MKIYKEIQRYKNSIIHKIEKNKNSSLNYKYNAVTDLAYTKNHTKTSCLRCGCTYLNVEIPFKASSASNHFLSFVVTRKRLTAQKNSHNLLTRRRHCFPFRLMTLPLFSFFWSKQNY